MFTCMNNFAVQLLHQTLLLAFCVYAAIYSVSSKKLSRDFSSVNNYRSVAVSTSASKIFLQVMLSLFMIVSNAEKF